MYGFLYRLMPGPAWLKVILLILLFLGVVAVLFTWVFPAIAPYMPFNQGTVGESHTRASALMGLAA